MGLASPVRSHNPDKIIINHSSYQLSQNEKIVLAKDLNFALSPKKVNYADYLTPYELLLRDIKEVSVDDNISWESKNRYEEKMLFLVWKL